MKRTLLLGAVALSTLAGAASASSSANQAILERYAPNIDVSALSDAQVATLMNIVNSSESSSKARALIQNVVN